MDTSSTDRIEKQILLHAPQSRVWRALTDAEEFGSWFRVKLDGRFTPGKRTTGKVTYPGYEHVTMNVWVERMEPETLFSFRWHPHAVELTTDYDSESATLVEFQLAAMVGGTLLTVVESGFDQLPAARRNEAFRMNSEGWGEQLNNIKRHVAG